jgi:hypothetical protein
VTTGEGTPTSADLARVLLDGTRRFAQPWLTRDAKTVVPLAGPARLDRTLAGRLHRVPRELGVGYLLAARVGVEHADEPVLRVDLTRDVEEQAPWRDADFLLCLPDLTGALLVTTDGYALLAGTAPFVRTCVSEGVDAARASFARHVRRLAGRHPELTAVAEELPPRCHAWTAPAQAPEESATAEMVNQMTALVGGSTSITDFMAGWLSARRRAIAYGERVRGRFSDILGDVFWAIEDYVEDPAERGPHSISGEELVAKVGAALTELRSLDEQTP